MVKVKDTASFIQRAIEVHGDRYDYSQTVWNGFRNPIIIICKVCGPITLAWANSHYLKYKCGCSVCNHKAAMDRKRKHPKREKSWCKKCGCETCRKSSICKNCTLPKVCACGKALRTKQSKHCECCYVWGKMLKTRLGDKQRLYKKVGRLNANPWIKWAVIKQSLLLSRSRVSTDKQKQFTIVNEQWYDWADFNKKTKLRAVESLWQKKCRNWQRGLVRRSQVELSYYS